MINTTKCLFVNFLASFLLTLIFSNLSGQKMDVHTADSLNKYWSAHKLTEFTNTLHLTHEAYRVFQELRDTCRMANVRNVQSSCYDAMGILDSALYVLLQVRSWNLEACETSLLNRTALNLSSVYLSTGDYDKVAGVCQSAMQRGIEDERMSDIKYNYAIALANLGRMDMAGLMFEELRFDAEKRGDHLDVVDALINLGVLQGMSQNVDSAEVCFLTALDICKEHACSSELGILKNLSSIAQARGDFRKQLDLCDRALLKAKEVGDLQSEVFLESKRSEAYYQLGNYDEAWRIMGMHKILRDSLLNLEKVKALADVQEKYESEKKVRQIKELEIKNLDSELRNQKVTQSRNWYLSGGILLLVMAIGLFSRLHFVRKSRAALRKEKDRSESLLLNILPAEVAEELKNKGKAEAKLINPVTVLFTDFKGFTTLSEQLSPEDLVKDLNTCFSEFDRIISKYGIEKIKTIGDAYMAAGGLPLPDERHAQNVVLAAFEMRDFVETGKQQKIKAGLPFFEIRLGIHTGPVVAGIVGVKKFQYDIWGDTVNTASRIESSGEVGKVNISESTYQLLKDEPNFAFERRGMITTKGKGELEMWFVRKNSKREQPTA